MRQSTHGKELRARLLRATGGPRRMAAAQRRHQGRDGLAPLRARHARRGASPPLELLLPRPRHRAHARLRGAAARDRPRSSSGWAPRGRGGGDGLRERVVDDATAIAEEDLARLRAVGLSKREVMDVILAATTRCFFSKTLDGLGVLPDAEYGELPDE